MCDDDPFNFLADSEEFNNRYMYETICPPEWTEWEGVQCLKCWAEELRELMLSGKAQDLHKFVGRAVILLHSDLAMAKLVAQRMALHAGFRFATVKANDVLDLSFVTSDPFLGVAPVLVFLDPDGDWARVDVTNNLELVSSTDLILRWRNQFIANLCRPIDGDFIVYVTAAASTESFPAELLSVGIFDRSFSIPEPSPRALGLAFLKEVGPDLCTDELKDSPHKVGLLVKDFDSVRDRGLAAVYLGRRARSNSRLIEFSDLVNVSIRGTTESDEQIIVNEVIRKQVAYHEAGHSLIAILDSGGSNIPDYSSVMPSMNFRGVVVRSYLFEDSIDGELTYRRFLHDIRIGLAGRAAEQVCLGVENISTGSMGDLKKCTNRATRAFSSWGFVPDMNDSNAGVNLAVVNEEASSSDRSYIQDMVRCFLNQQYKYVLNELIKNRHVLDAIATRLQSDPIVDHLELATICAQFNICTEAGYPIVLFSKI